jgi:hypothetical protein
VWGGRTVDLGQQLREYSIDRFSTAERCHPDAGQMVDHEAHVGPNVGPDQVAGKRARDPPLVGQVMPLGGLERVPK